MTRVRLAPFVEEIHGTFNGAVFKKSPKGNTILTKLPDMSNVEWSQAQKNNRESMARANDYAHAAMADPIVSAIYEKRGAREKRVPYRIAVSDYYKGKNLFEEQTAPPARKNKKAGDARLQRPRKGFKKPSQAQQEQWDRITEAASYAAAALADPQLGEYYEAEAKELDMQPRHMAMFDYLNGKNLLAKK